MEFLELMAVAQRQDLRRQRVFRDRTNPFEFPDHIFKSNYRIPRENVLELCHLLRPMLEHPTRRNSPLPVETQVLIGLSFMATGSFQSVVGRDHYHQVSQPTVSRVISAFLDGMLQLVPRFIQFPISDADQQKRKLNFFKKRRIPGVVGVVDGTHIHIQKPSVEDAHVYRNRKGRNSLNVQMICDNNLLVLDVVAMWPGSSHDAMIWRNSGIRNALHSGKIANCLILGDSGYPLEPWLLTPYNDPKTPQELYFNQIFKRARGAIERCIGVIKSRFRVLDDSSGYLIYRPEKVCKIVTVCCILHNIATGVSLKEKEQQDLDSSSSSDSDECSDSDNENGERNRANDEDVQLLNQGSRIREELALNLFKTKRNRRP